MCGKVNAFQGFLCCSFTLKKIRKIISTSDKNHQYLSLVTSLPGKVALKFLSETYLYLLIYDLMRETGFAIHDKSIPFTYVFSQIYSENYGGSISNSLTSIFAIMQAVLLGFFLVLTLSWWSLFLTSLLSSTQSLISLEPCCSLISLLVVREASVT